MEKIEKCSKPPSRYNIRIYETYMCETWGTLKLDWVCLKIEPEIGKSQNHIAMFGLSIIRVHQFHPLETYFTCTRFHTLDGVLGWRLAKLNETLSLLASFALDTKKKHKF